MSVSILNYGMANLRSVQKAFEHVGVDARIITTPAQVVEAGRLVLPGVGAVADALGHLRQQGLDVAIRQFVQTGRPFLGICLGLQMLFDRCFEDGEHAGLGIIPGDCVRFEVDQTHGLKVPHMGWNSLRVVGESPLFGELPIDAHAYFVHSYFVKPTDSTVVSSYTDYGREFVSSVRLNNILATQFHPEKSQAVGLRMLKNFAGMK
jgi:imidazole glycerol-phosphate synthase subunit HisH